MFFVIIHAVDDVCFLYAQKPYILYFLNFQINNDAIFCSILQLCKISGPYFFICRRVHRWIYIMNLFNINLVYFNFNIYYLLCIYYLIFFTFHKFISLTQPTAYWFKSQINIQGYHNITIFPVAKFDVIIIH